MSESYFVVICASETFKEDQNFDKSSNKKIYKVKLEKLYKSKLYKDSIDCSESQSESSESISVIVDETKSNKSNDDFEWIWTYESSRTTESEPDENCLNMVKGREKFVRNTLLQQDLYIEANQLQPALFVATVSTFFHSVIKDLFISKMGKVTFCLAWILYLPDHSVLVTKLPPPFDYSRCT